jgi:hypothetical protein
LDAIVPGAPVKPEGVPDKFWDAKTGEVNYVEWNKAHTALETKFHEPVKTPEVIAAEKVIADAKAAAAGAPPGSEGAIADARAEYAKDGKLSEETFTKLAAVGLDRTTVDGYLSGVAAQGVTLTAAAHDAAEGADNYGKMLEWAEENLSEGETNTFNALIASNDEGVIKEAVTGLYKNFKENVTVEGDRIGGSGPTSGANTFASKAEMVAAMNLPSEAIPGKTRYETDPAYRIECQNKIKASKKAGINIYV